MRWLRDGFVLIISQDDAKPKGCRRTISRPNEGGGGGGRAAAQDGTADCFTTRFISSPAKSALHNKRSCATSAVARTFRSCSVR